MLGSISALSQNIGTYNPTKETKMRPDLFVVDTELGEDEDLALGNIANAANALAVLLGDTLDDGRYKSLAITALEQTYLWADRSVRLQGLL